MDKISRLSHSSPWSEKDADSINHELGDLVVSYVFRGVSYAWEAT